VLSVDLKTERPNVKFPCFGFVKNALNWDDFTSFHIDCVLKLRVECRVSGNDLMLTFV